MNRFKAIAVFITAVLLLSAGPASAGLDPSYRGDANSVHVIFDWVSHQQAQWQTSLFETGPSTYPLEPTVPVATDDGTDTRILLPNFIDPLPLKLMRIQLFFDGAVSGDLIAYDVYASDPVSTSWSVVGGSGPVNTNTHWIDIEIIPNPDWERITIFGSVTGGGVIPGNLYRIEVDTVSVIPEPATLSLLAIGGLALLRRRRRAA